MLKHSFESIAEYIAIGKKLLNTEKAFIAAPMAGGITTPEFVSEVSNAGGLGSFATGYLLPQQVKESVERIQQLTTNNFAANVFVPQEVRYNEIHIKLMQEKLAPYYHELNIPMPDPLSYKKVEQYYDEILEALHQAKIPVLSFTFGCLSLDIIEKFHAIGTKIIGTATTPREAEFLADQGCDAIVAQGIEAGGHRGSFLDDPNISGMGLMSLITSIRNTGITVPIFAAGGLATPEQLLASILLGANGCSVGTALLLAKESGANSAYQKKLFTTKGDTHLTSNFTGKLSRALLHNELDETINQANIVTPDYPITHVLTQPLRKANPERFGSFWAGQSNTLSCKIFAHLSIKEIVDLLYTDIQKLKA